MGNENKMRSKWWNLNQKDSFHHCLWCFFVCLLFFFLLSSANTQCQHRNTNMDFSSSVSAVLASSSPSVCPAVLPPLTASSLQSTWTPLPGFSTRRPLHLAARNGLATVVQALLSRGATVLAVDEEGKSLLHCTHCFLCWLVCSLHHSEGFVSSDGEVRDCMTGWGTGVQIHEPRGEAYIAISTFILFCYVEDFKSCFHQFRTFKQYNHMQTKTIEHEVKFDW